MMKVVSRPRVRCPEGPEVRRSAATEPEGRRSARAHNSKRSQPSRPAHARREIREGVGDTFTFDSGLRDRRDRGKNWRERDKP